ncbi:lysosome-associated membrane glycoprotein 1 [Anoplolepis gracilipes]|uniref:lysosome-associated membrane glycoprotein 1 n=1 Tax=Anoplolepis gracilipes TaxID=354296 RepID=UPI003BA15B2F
MLKPLLLLCLAATIVSAGDSKNVTTNNTSVPINSAGDNVATNSQLPSETTKLLVHPNDKDASVSSESTTTSGTPSNENIPLTNTITSESTIKSTPISTITSEPTTTKSTTTTTTTTTTPKPTTTPIPSPTTTPTPVPTTPLPPPSTGKWHVRENNVTCIVVQMAAQLNVSYLDANNVTIHRAVDIPSNSNGTGQCGKSAQILTLLWGSQSNSTITPQNNFTLHFEKNETDKLYSLHHLEITLVAEKSPTNKTVTLVHKAPQFNTGLSNSYRCLKEQSLNLTLQGNNNTVGQLKVSKLQFQAFRNDNDTVFGLAKDCSFDTPDIVPITVGCALAGLVVVVLIAYLVGRRRSQSRGYLSM